MGYKGARRKTNAAFNRLESAQRKRENELKRQQARLEKMQEIERANYEVNLFESQMESLLDIHKELTLTVNWESVLSSDPPEKPKNLNENEKIAQMNFDKYKPGILDKLFQKTESKKAELINEIEKSKNADEQTYQRNLNQYESDLSDWESSKKLAKRILDKESESYLEAIKSLDPFSEISYIGKKLEFEIESEILQVNLFVHDENIIPSESKSILKSGKLSLKKISKSKQNDLYQDHVCSALLRISRELFSMLPIDFVIVNAIGLILNTQTGFKEEKPIISVAFTKTVVDSLIFDYIDASDSMDNFLHKMNFKSTKGFAPIEILNSEDFIKQEQ